MSIDVVEDLLEAQSFRQGNGLPSPQIIYLPSREFDQLIEFIRGERAFGDDPPSGAFSDETMITLSGQEYRRRLI